MRPIGWQVLGFLAGYAAEEGFATGHGVFLLQLLGSVMTLPGWASKVYVALVLAVLGLLGGALRLRAPNCRRHRAHACWHCRRVRR